MLNVVTLSVIVTLVMAPLGTLGTLGKQDNFCLLLPQTYIGLDVYRSVVASMRKEQREVQLCHFLLRFCNVKTQ